MIGSGDSGEGGRKRRLEGVIPDIIKRAVEVGVEKAAEAPDTIKSFVGDLKLPKEIAHYLLSQVDETKNGLFRVVAKEMRDFLENTNIAGELQRALTTVQFEINTTIRFRPNDGKNEKAAEDEAADEDEGDKDSAAKLSKPEVKTRVHVTRGAARRRRGGGGSGTTNEGESSG